MKHIETPNRIAHQLLLINGKTRLKVKNKIWSGDYEIFVATIENWSHGGAIVYLVN